MIGTLTYHSIDSSESAISVGAAVFDDHLRWLTSGQVPVLSLHELTRQETDSDDAVAVTFDDGFANVKEPVRRLLSHGIAPTVFAVTEHVGGTNAWGGREQQGIPTLPLLGWKDLEELMQAGAHVEAHSRTHPHLAAVSGTQVEDELLGCADDLRQRLGVTACHWAYPYGEWSPRLCRAVEECYRYGHTTEMRTFAANEKRSRLPRLDAYYFQKAGALDDWGSPSFTNRLRWLRTRRKIGSALRWNAL